MLEKFIVNLCSIRIIFFSIRIAIQTGIVLFFMDKHTHYVVKITILKYIGHIIYDYPTLSIFDG